MVHPNCRVAARLSFLVYLTQACLSLNPVRSDSIAPRSGPKKRSRKPSLNWSFQPTRTGRRRRKRLLRALETERDPNGARRAYSRPARETCASRAAEGRRVARTPASPSCSRTSGRTLPPYRGRQSLCSGRKRRARRVYGRLPAKVRASPAHQKEHGRQYAARAAHRDPGRQADPSAAPKGFGSENASALAMLTPSDGVCSIEQFVVDTVARSGAFACPPLVVGVGGIGGTMEKARSSPSANPARRRRAPDPDAAALEARLLERINALGIEPGLGGDTTALAVHAGRLPDAPRQVTGRSQRPVPRGAPPSASRCNGRSHVCASYNFRLIAKPRGSSWPGARVPQGAPSTPPAARP